MKDECFDEAFEEIYDEAGDDKRIEITKKYGFIPKKEDGKLTAIELATRYPADTLEKALLIKTTKGE